MGESSAVFAVIHASLQSNEPTLTVKELCQIAGVSRSGYYNWVKSEATRLAQEEADKKDFALILEAYNFRGYKKGVRSIYMRLLRTGIHMNQKKIRRLMHKYNLRYPGKAITGYTIFHDWTIVENSIVLDMGSTLL